MSKVPESATTSPIRFHIKWNIDFAAASRQAWMKSTKGSLSDAPRYNLRPLPHRVDSVKAFPSIASSARDEKSEEQPPRPTHANDTRRSKRSRNAPNSFRERLSEILPVDTRKRLQKKPETCVALTKKRGNPRCTRLAKGSLEVLKRVPSTLTGQIIESADGTSIAFARDLVESALCGKSHQKGCLSDFDKICEGLDELSEDDRAVFDQWLMALATEPPSTEEDLPASQMGTESSPMSSPRITRRQETLAVSFTTNRIITRSTTDRSQPASTLVNHSASLTPKHTPFQTYNPKFTRYILKSHPKSTEKFLRDRIIQPLTKREIGDGYIYMYWFPGKFGYIKIGVTKNADIEKRLKGWRSKCRHAAEVVDFNLLVPVKHAYRVEKLVHAELYDVRFREDGCRGCGGNHVEWFEERVEHAYAVTRKFAEWMETEPYEPHEGGGETAGWTLKPSEKIEELCRPLERSVEEMKTRKGKTGKGKTRKLRG